MGVKESVLKALGVGMAVPSPTSVDADDLGRPVLHLAGVAAERASELGIVQWSVSISHDGDYAIAVVVGSDRIRIPVGHCRSGSTSDSTLVERGVT